MFALLEAIRDALTAALPEVKTCHVGIENGLSPDDYPILRIVPQRSSHSGVMGRTAIDLVVYYGVALTEADAGGLEAVYEALSDMEDAVILAMETTDGFTAVWRETVTDEDRLEHYKLFASRFEVVG